MLKNRRMGAVLALGAAFVFSLAMAQNAAASTNGGRAKYNFVAGRSILGKSLAHPSASVRKSAGKTQKRTSARRMHRSGLRGRRSAGYAACRSAARRFGVPISTALAVCRLESGFRCSAVGRAGELGLLQIKLRTARALGYRGSRRGLLKCSTGAYWGMKHLALAIRRGGVWKHNAGLYAKRPNAMARRYARKVAMLRRRYR